ncbi:hypothetical protein MLD38_027354 [Melastoma candidum]|uniref:Uncharacterized protein n=1 Tax=Melastoma candidum TaxID=119954 RepID=A0ACB9P7E7_9MYRT|nr:hypothetical protein MLD38_027354 [Melastoma candidum]
MTAGMTIVVLVTRSDPHRVLMLAPQSPLPLQPSGNSNGPGYNFSTPPSYSSTYDETTDTACRNMRHMKVPPLYVFARIVGSVIGTCIGGSIHEVKARFIVTGPLQGGSTPAFCVEMLATVMIVLVITSLAHDHQSIRSTETNPIKLPTAFQTGSGSPQ